MRLLDEKRRFTTLGLLLVIVVVLAALAITSAAHAAPAPRPTSEFNCGYISCTLYFNESETERMAAAGPGISAAMVLCNKAKGGWIIAVTCAGVGAYWAASATAAKSQHKCLKVWWSLANFQAVGITGSYPCGQTPNQVKAKGVHQCYVFPFPNPQLCEGT